jgi:hypothetical protein
MLWIWLDEVDEFEVDILQDDQGVGRDAVCVSAAQNDFEACISKPLDLRQGSDEDDVI